VQLEHLGAASAAGPARQEASALLAAQAKRTIPSAR
jgi:hypothetical protein